jgi:hypothetical protein
MMSLRLSKRYRTKYLMRTRQKSFAVVNKANIPADHEQCVSIELADDDRGFLPNRLTTAQRDAMIGPPVGLMIYNLDNLRLETFDGTDWEKTTQGALMGVNNLSDLSNLVAARANLGLGTISVYNASDFIPAMGAIIINGLPTVDPQVVNQLWNDAGTLKISAG